MNDKCIEGEVHMEQAELQKIYKELESLRTRVITLESIINGCIPKQAGRKHKLSLEQQSEIIQKHNHGMSYSALAKEYAVSRTTIYNTCHGKSNSHTSEKATTYTPMHRKNPTK